MHLQKKDQTFEMRKYSETIFLVLFLKIVHTFDISLILEHSDLILIVRLEMFIIYKQTFFRR